MSKGSNFGISKLISADLVLYNGKIATLDGSNSVVQAVAARDGKILMLGDNDSVRKLSSPNTEVIDVSGRTVVPGLIDSHCHPNLHATLFLKWFDIRWPIVRSVADLLSFIHEKVCDMPSDSWFLAFGYHDQKTGGYPSIDELDAAAGGRPVFILCISYHIGIANRAAFALSGVDKDTPNPSFGQLDRDPSTGELTGVIREKAIYTFFLDKIRESDTVDDLVNVFPRLFEQYLSYGITSLHNSVTPFKAIQAYQILREKNRLPLRVGIIISGAEEGLVESFIRAGIRSGFGDEWLRIIGVEWFPDASTIGRTAAYYEPYVGRPYVGEPTPNYGRLLFEAEDLKTRAIAAHKAGLTLCVEGIGDRGIDFTLDAFEAALAVHPVQDHRMRVEHCPFITPKILARFKRLGVIASSTTGSIYELGDAYIANRGMESMKWMWPHRSLIDAGVPAPGHSDIPVTHINSMQAIYSLVTRKTDTGQLIGPEQAITVNEAIRAYTTLGAYAGREENIKGSIEVGKLADMVVLDKDIFTVPAEEIKEVRVDLTIVGGVVRYRRRK